MTMLVCLLLTFTVVGLKLLFFSPPNSSDKDEPDASEVESSMLGFQSYWDASYAEDLANFREHGHAGEIWLVVL